MRNSGKSREKFPNDELSFRTLRGRVGDRDRRAADCEARLYRLIDSEGLRDHRDCRVGAVASLIRVDGAGDHTNGGRGRGEADR